MRLQLKKEIQIPDPFKLARYRKSPEFGPRILFFSGGTALRALSQKLIHYTHNSIHIVTPFDSGGSSAELRKAFSMPAVGDTRNRLMALADQSLKGNPEIVRLFHYRFPKEKEYKDIVLEFDSMVQGEHDLIRDIPEPMRNITEHYLLVFQRMMPRDFELRGANIGNLVLAAGYLENDRHLDPIIYIYSKLAEIRGTVRPVTNMDLHLVTELEDGTVLPGQHLLTGKQVNHINSKVRGIYLTEDLRTLSPFLGSIQGKIEELIREADLICFPMGSFFSSIVANLLLDGIGKAISQNKSPKVFIPNTYFDPELYGMTLEEQVKMLLKLLSNRTSGDNKVLDYIFLDNDITRYSGLVDQGLFQRMGVSPLFLDFVTEESSPLIDPERLSQVLLSLT